MNIYLRHRQLTAAAFNRSNKPIKRLRAACAHLQAMALEQVVPELRPHKIFKWLPKEPGLNRAARRKLFFAGQVARVDAGKTPRHITGAVRRGLARGKAA